MGWTEIPSYHPYGPYPIRMIDKMRLGELICPHLKIVLAKVQPAKGGVVFSVSKHNDGYMRHAKAYSHGKAEIYVLT